MPPATPQRIQDAVEKFLRGGSASDIWDLAYKHFNNRLLLVESAGVVNKLVKLVVHNQPPGGVRWVALDALHRLLHIGRVAQDAIARAQKGDIFTWLAGPQDHGRADIKTDLITKLTENHPTNTRLLEAACAGDAASLANVVCESVRSNDSSMAAIAMDMLFKTQRDNDTKWTPPPDVIAFFTSIVNSVANSADATLSNMQDHVVHMLVKYLHVGEVRDMLTQSSMAAIDNIAVLQSVTSNETSKLLAVIRLAEAAGADESVALQIVAQGVIPALIASIQSSDNGAICVHDLRNQSARLLESLPQSSSRVREELLKSGVWSQFVPLYQSKNPQHETTVLKTFRSFLHEQNHALAIASAWGIPFLIELILSAKQEDPKEDIVSLKVMTTLLIGQDDSTNDANQRTMVNYDGGIAVLVGVFNTNSTNEHEAIGDFAKKMSDLIPLLILRLRDDALKTKKHDTLVVVLTALETLSQIRENQCLFQQHKGIKRLVGLLTKAKHDHEKMRCARILTNVSYKNRHVAQLIVERGVVGPLIAMVESSSPKTRTSALLALRNLTSSDENRAKIGSLELFVHVVEMVSNGRTMKQKEVAAAVLGNLSLLRSNREQIAALHGLAALLAFLRESTTPNQVETAAAALWAVVDTDRIASLCNIGGLAVLETAIKGHKPDELHWASRLHRRLSSAVTK